MKEKGSYAVPVVGVVLLLMPTLYVGGYYVLVDPHLIRIEGARMSRIAGYRTEWLVVKDIFYPIHVVDRKIRPTYWYWDIDLRSQPPWQQPVKHP